MISNELTCSVICPAYNESSNLTKLVSTIAKELTNYNYELIIIDDGSSDNTLDTLRELSKENSSIKYISFTRNFGHQFALTAGIKSAKGKCVVMLDADMQHPPSLIPSMLKKWMDGYKVVQCVRKEKGSSFKSITSKQFYKIMSSMSDVPLVPGTSDFRLIDEVIVQHLQSLKSPIFLRGYIPWLGHKTYFLDYKADIRNSGESKYTLSKMLKLSFLGMITQSTIPLKLAKYVGTIISVLAFIYLLYALTIYFFTENSVPGWTSILISILFLGGFQLIFLGIIGEYLGKIFERSNDKPLYQIKEQHDNQ